LQFAPKGGCSVAKLPGIQTSISRLAFRIAGFATLLAAGFVIHGSAAQFSQSPLSVLYSFADSPDGSNPFQSTLFRDSAGNLSGTTVHGGAQSNGTIFKVSRSGTETVLYRFKPDLDGQAPSPQSGVIGDSAGNLYGTLPFGGQIGDGIVFKLDTTGKLTILHAFSGGGDGRSPFGGLVLDASGNLYGTATAAGNVNACGNGCGLVYKIDSSGNFSVLYTFTGGDDGGIPQDTLILDSAGNLYGTTTAGGANDQGVVFRLSSTGQESALYSFSATGQSDGMEPVAGLTRDSAGNLYGATYYGGGGSCFDGINPGCGTIFKIDTTGTFSVLHSLSGTTDGGWVTGALVLNTDGNLYGTGSGSGQYGAGTLFKITTTGTFTTIHNFTGGKDGTHPMGAMIGDGTGALYGTSAGGGAFGFGEVFKFVP
jgi:uncharacterized repeat protein (TIGR03803 family)